MSVLPQTLQTFIWVWEKVLERDRYLPEGSAFQLNLAWSQFWVYKKRSSYERERMKKTMWPAKTETFISNFEDV